MHTLTRADHALIATAALACMALIGSLAWGARIATERQAYPPGTHVAELLAGKTGEKPLDHTGGRFRLILWFDPQCTACIEMIPDLPELVGDHALTILTPGQEDEVSTLFGQLGLRLGVRHLARTETKFRASPTMLVVNGNGRVLAEFVGRPKDQGEVAARALAIRQLGERESGEHDDE
jgi:hypothetical protein